MSFFLSALRAIVEMLGMCLLAQGVLYLLAGEARERNPVYRFFALLSRGPRQLVACCLPGSVRPWAVSLLTFLLLFTLWLGLAILRRFL
jgi:hypothetical protein